MTFREILSSLWRRRLTILITVVVAVVAALAYSKVQTPKYQSTAMVQENGISSSASGGQSSPVNLPDPVQELGSTAFMVFCLTGIAELLTARQRFEPAVRLLAASAHLRQAFEQNPLLGPQFQAAFTPALTATQAAFSPAAFAQAWAAGQALSLDQATDLGLAELASTPPPTNAATAVGA